MKATEIESRQSPFHPATRKTPHRTSALARSSCRLISKKRAAAVLTGRIRRRARCRDRIQLAFVADRLGSVFVMFPDCDEVADALTESLGA